MLGNLVFDRASHKFYDEMGELPSVTKILSAEGILPDYSFADPFPALRGTFVHKLCQAVDLGVPLESVPAPEGLSLQIGEGYVRAYRSYLEKTGIEWDHVEKELGHPIYRFAGILDRCKRGGILLDIKTGARGSSEPLQLGAYWDLLTINEIPVRPDGVFLYLAADGSFLADPVPGLNKLARIFQAVKTTFDYKRKRG